MTGAIRRFLIDERIRNAFALTKGFGFVSSFLNVLIAKSESSGFASA